jgi:hypothetical protein
MSIVRTVATVMLAGTTLLRAQATAPLPDPQPFFEAVRRNLARSQEEQNLFAYKERRTELNLNPFGRLGTDGTRLVEVTPTPDGAQLRRLLERNGVPVPNSQPSRRENRMPQGGSVVQDVASVLDVAISHREMLEGRPAIVVRFKARPDAKPRTREGRIARAFTGLIWVDESAHEVRRIEATAIDDITFGYGMLARVNEGSVVQVERRLAEGDAWLPTSMRFKGEGRALLFRKLVIDFAVEWFDYRRVL